MGAFISQLLDVDLVEARKIQKTFFYEYGTTLRGLMDVHRIEPEDFLDFVHDIDVSVIDPDHALSDALDRLEGRKVIFTNGSHGHAENVLGQIGIRHHFDAVFDIADADYIPKPEAEAYAMFVAHVGIDTTRAAMFEDLARNLKHPHAMGMTTGSGEVAGKRVGGIHQAQRRRPRGGRPCASRDRRSGGVPGGDRIGNKWGDLIQIAPSLCPRGSRITTECVYRTARGGSQPDGGR